MSQIQIILFIYVIENQEQRSATGIQLRDLQSMLSGLTGTQGTTDKPPGTIYLLFSYLYIYRLSQIYLLFVMSLQKINFFEWCFLKLLFTE